MSAGIACRVLPHARLRARLFPEDEVDRQYQAEETCEVVPAQGVRLHENQREQREDRERDHFLDDFQLPDRERPAELRRPDAVGRNLEAVFEQGDAPAEEHDDHQSEAFEFGFEGDMPVPGQRHEGVGDDEQQYGGETTEHGVNGFVSSDRRR